MSKKNIPGLLIFISLLIVFLPFCTIKKDPSSKKIDWLKKNMVQLNNIDPDISETALMALKEKINNAVIVGMGEQTHGTHEFWKIRHKITRFLIQEMGFTVVLNETSFPGALSVHEWIQTGEGNLPDILIKYRML